MDVYWTARREEDVPECNDWLGPREKTHLRTLNFLKRRIEWRLGRWTAKCALAALYHLPPDADLLARIEICPNPSGAPEAFMQDIPAELTLSISHRAGTAFCVVAPSLVRLGCDLEVIEPRSDAFICDYFTADEKRRMEQAGTVEGPCLANLFWSAKESALKALQVGLRRDTRSVVVQLSEPFLTGRWNSLKVRSEEGDSFGGWWREFDGIVQTVVADRCFAPPVQLARSSVVRAA